VARTAFLAAVCSQSTAGATELGDLATEGAVWLVGAHLLVLMLDVRLVAELLCRDRLFFSIGLGSLRFDVNAEIRSAIIKVLFAFTISGYCVRDCEKAIKSGKMIDLHVKCHGKY
jgi:hypothetical protein